MSSETPPLAVKTDPDIEDFCALVKARLYAGKAEYGDKSFDKPEKELRQERSEEALDGAGWSFVLWKKFRDSTPHGYEIIDRMKGQLVELRRASARAGHSATTDLGVINHCIKLMGHAASEVVVDTGDGRMQAFCSLSDEKAFLSFLDKAGRALSPNPSVVRTPLPVGSRPERARTLVCLVEQMAKLPVVFTHEEGGHAVSLTAVLNILTDVIRV